MILYLIDGSSRFSPVYALNDEPVFLRTSPQFWQYLSESAFCLLHFEQVLGMLILLYILLAH